ncbi:hypothetical protein H5T51_00210, partial [Candidatus Bathyarchaeota archaeon]|nr:hypothetical protein [Candidatus Bathyarchaeota archaeon]
MVSYVKINGELVEGFFKERITRFSAIAKIDGDDVLCFLPNPGRLEEILHEGARLILRKAARSGRKTAYDIIA